MNTAKHPVSEPAPLLSMNLSELWGQRGLISLVTIAAVGLGSVYLLLAPKTFEIQRRIVVQPAELALQLVPTEVRDPEFLATQAEIMRSPLIVGAALSRAPVAVPEDYTKGDVAYVLESLAINPLVQTDIIKISFRGRDAEEARRFVAALIASFQAQVRERDHMKHGEDLALLLQREAELRGELDHLQAEYAEFRRHSPLIGTSGRDTYNIAEDLMAYVGQQLAQTRSRKVDLQNKLRAFDMVREDQHVRAGRPMLIPASQVKVAGAAAAREEASETLSNKPGVVNVLRSDAAVGADDLAEIQLELSRAKVRASEIAHRYGPKHPERKAADEQVAYWEHLLEERVAAAASVLTQEAQIAEQSEESLEESYNREHAKIKALDEYLVQDAVWLGKTKRAEAIYEATLAQLNEYQTAEASRVRGRTSVNVTMLDGPESHQQLIWPRPKPFLGVSAALGLLAGVLAAAVRPRRRAAAAELAAPASQPSPAGCPTV